MIKSFALNNVVKFIPIVVISFISYFPKKQLKKKYDENL